VFVVVGTYMLAAMAEFALALGVSALVNVMIAVIFVRILQQDVRRVSRKASQEIEKRADELPSETPLHNR
jgi:hypothetical protein